MLISLMNDLLPVFFYFILFFLVYSKWFKTHIVARFCGATRVFANHELRKE